METHHICIRSKNSTFITVFNVIYNLETGEQLHSYSGGQCALTRHIFKANSDEQEDLLYTCLLGPQGIVCMAGDAVQRP